jgi:hypothetical protein
MTYMVVVTVAGVTIAVDVTVADTVLVTEVVIGVVVAETEVVVLVNVVVVVVVVVLIPEETVKVVWPVMVTGTVYVFVFVTVTVAGGVRFNTVEQILLPREGNWVRTPLTARMTGFVQSAAARPAIGAFGRGSSADVLARRQ